MNYKYFIPYGKQNINKKDIESIIAVLKSEFLTQGPTISLFENAVAQECGSLLGVAVNSATSALHIACLALGLGKDDWLWTSPITFVASANCGKYCGAKVDFVDINPETGLLSIQALKEKLDQAKKNKCLPKILIPVHLGGASCNMEELAKLAEKYKFSIIEDASHAIGGTYKDKQVGSCQYSDIAVFSFHPVKIITTGEGGVATTNNRNLYRKMLQLRSHGITKNSNDFIEKASGPWSYEQQILGFNYRITDIQCALGISQLNRLQEMIKTRNSLYNSYKEMLKDLPVKLLEIPQDVKSSHHLAIIRLKNKNIKFHKFLFNFMRKSNIGVQLHYSPVHLNPYYKEQGFKKGDFPEAESYGKNAISLPLFPEITESELYRIVETLKDGIKLYND